MHTVRLQALYRAPPQQPTRAVVKPEGGRETGTEELYNIKWDYHIVWGLNDQSHRGHQSRETTLTGESPWGLNPAPS
jgi:hypothetical protein